MSRSEPANIFDAGFSRRNFLLGASSLAAGGLFFACSGSGGSAADDSSASASTVKPPTGPAVKLGYVAALTGALGSYGTETLKALQLAAKDVNKMGGILGRPVEVQAVDNQSMPDTVPALMRQLVQDGCHVLLGASASATTIVAARTADQLKVPLLVPMEAADAIIGTGRAFVFKLAASMLADTGYAAEGLRATMKAGIATGAPPKSAYIMHASTGALPDAKTAWLRVFNAEYPDVKILETVSVDEATTSDFAPLISRAQAARPDLLLLAFNTGPAQLLYPALQRSGWFPNATVSVTGGSTASTFIKTVGAASNQDIAGNFWTQKLPAKQGAVFTPQKFFDDFSAAYGVAPSGIGAYYYACMGMIHDALTAAGSTDSPQKISDAFRALNFDGLSGDSFGMWIVGHGLKFDSTGQNTAARAVVTQIQNGEYIPVYPDVVATGKIIYPRSVAK